MAHYHITSALTGNCMVAKLALRAQCTLRGPQMGLNSATTGLQPNTQMGQCGDPSNQKELTARRHHGVEETKMVTEPCLL